MARVGGRRAWLAWPATVICVGIVAALLWLAVPGIPGAIAFAGDVLRIGGEANDSAVATAEPTLGPVATTDCRSLYPDRLWSELTWTPDVALAQGAVAPRTVQAAVVAALAPTVLLSCEWHAGDRSIVTTLATVRDGSAQVARAALASRGAACEDVDGGVRCSSTSGGVDEVLEVRGDRWLATSFLGWHPAQYAQQVAGRVWR